MSKQFVIVPIVKGDPAAGDVLNMAVDTYAVSSIVPDPDTGLTHFRVGPATFKTSLSIQQLLDAIGAELKR